MMIVRTLEAAHPPFAAAMQKLRLFTAELAAVERNQAALESRIREASPRAQAIETAARQLIGGEQSPDIAKEEALRKELTSVGDRKAVLRRAIEIVKYEVNRLASDARAIIAEDVRPIAAEIGARAVRHLIAFGQVQEEAFALAEACETADFHGMPGLFVPILPGIERDGAGLSAYGLVASFLYDAVVCGVIQPNDIPAAWRERWARTRPIVTPADVEHERREALRRAQAATQAEKERLEKAAARAARR